MAVLCRFDELRIKTDKQLLQVVNSTLDRGVREVSHAIRSGDNRAVAGDHHLRAKTAYAEAARLVPLIRQMVGEEPSGVETKLEHLKKMLEASCGRPGPGSLRRSDLHGCAGIVERQRLPGRPTG